MTKSLRSIASLSSLIVASTVGCGGRAELANEGREGTAGAAAGGAPNTADAGAPTVAESACMIADQLSVSHFAVSELPGPPDSFTYSQVALHVALTNYSDKVVRQPAVAVTCESADVGLTVNWPSFVDLAPNMQETGVVYVSFARPLATSSPLITCSAYPVVLPPDWVWTFPSVPPPPCNGPVHGGLEFTIE